VGALSVKPGCYDPERWFLSGRGLIYTMYDFAGYIYAFTRPVPSSLK